MTLWVFVGMGAAKGTAEETAVPAVYKVKGIRLRVEVEEKGPLLLPAPRGEPCLTESTLGHALLALFPRDHRPGTCGHPRALGGSSLLASPLLKHREGHAGGNWLSPRNTYLSLPDPQSRVGNNRQV